MAKHELLCFLDSDCIWNPGWLNVATRLIRENPYKLAFNGAVLFENPNFKVPFYFHIFEFHEFLGRRSFRPRFLHSGNLLIRKSFFEEVGGFAEDIPMCTDFTFASHMNEGLLSKIYYEPELSITHLAHLIDEKALIEKARLMGYWRGRVESRLPARLRLQGRPWFAVGRSFLGLLFLMAILKRSLALHSLYKGAAFRGIPRIYKFCRLWALGFKQAIKEKAVS